MLIDTHQHVFWQGRDDAGLIADLDEHRIDLAWLLTWEIGPEEDDRVFHPALNPEHLRTDGTHPGIPLSDLIKARDRYPDRFVLGYCPHPLRGDAPSLFEAAYKMHGVRVCGEWKFRVLFDDPRCINLFRKAGELGCPVVLHLDVPYLLSPEDGRAIYQPSWFGGEIVHLERTLQACPDTNFIGHAPGFWREISADADTIATAYNPPDTPVIPGGKIDALLNEYSNLYADLSAGSALRALSRDENFTKAFLERWADRLLFARDYYGGELMQLLLRLNLSEATKQKIFSDNAQRLLV